MTTERLLEIAKDRLKCEFCIYIDDEKACKKCQEVKPIEVYELRHYYSEVVKAFKERLQREKQPTADVAPVVRGEWIVCGDGDNVPFMCTHCCKVAQFETPHIICPSCGADMRKAVE